MNSKGKGVTRRSKRNKEKNKVIAESLLNSDSLTGDIPSEIKDIHVGLLAKQASRKTLGLKDPIKKLEYSCKGCGRPEAPIKRYKKNHWIGCECCGGWWHIECACLSKESADKFEEHKIDYTCALCVFDVLPGVTVRRKNCETVAPRDVDSQGGDEIQLPIFVDDNLDPEHESAVTSIPTLYKSTPTKSVSTPQVPNSSSVSTPQEPISKSPVTCSQVDSTPA